MGIFKKLASVFSSQPRGDRNVFWLYVECAHCGEIIESRINLYNDLSADTSDDSKVAYFTRKVLVGNQRCFRPIEVKLQFDQNRNLIDRQITGGQFSTKEAYLDKHSSRN